MQENTATPKDYVARSKTMAVRVAGLGMSMPRICRQRSIPQWSPRGEGPQTEAAMNEPRGRHLCRNSISAPCDRRREAVDHDVGERMAMSPLHQAVYRASWLRARSLCPPQGRLTVFVDGRARKLIRGTSVTFSQVTEVPGLDPWCEARSKLLLF